MVQKDRQPRGRPRTFDESEAVDRATQVFWAKGYDGVTIDDLVAGMGVGRPSLYAIFGDKQTLFVRCLQEYAQRKGALSSQALLAPASVQEAVRNFLRYAVESTTEEGSAPGCLMVSVAPLVDDARVRGFLLRAEADAARLVEQRLQAGVEAGELPPSYPVEERASQILDLVRGLALRARLEPSREKLLRDAERAAALVVPTPTRGVRRGSRRHRDRTPGGEGRS
jgi:AcrR family transcriptional regulator